MIPPDSILEQNKKKKNKSRAIERNTLDRAMDDDPLIIVIDTIFPNKKKKKKRAITKNMSRFHDPGLESRRAYRKHFARVHAPLRPGVCLSRWTRSCDIT